MDTVFQICAVLGGALFLINLVIQFVVGGDTDIDLDADVSADVGDIHSHGSDASFKLLSFQGLTSFFMMFGLVGLAMLRQSHAPSPLSTAVAVAAGLGSVWVIEKIFMFMKNLQSSGTMDLNKAVGQEGSVYLTIPAGGTGKVQISVQDHLKVFDARSESGEEIATGAAIRVERVVNGNVMIVRKI